MNFSTFGPFAVADWTQTGLTEFWDSVQADQEDLNRREGEHYPTDLRKGIGVYVFVREESGGGLTPLYVGKTDRGYERRFAEHLKNNQKMAMLFNRNSGRIRVFIVPQVTSSGALTRETGKKSRSIDRVEFALIGSCLMKNSDLLNCKEKRFHKWLHVPGYLNSKPKDYDESAQRLAKMLEV